MILPLCLSSWSPQSNSTATVVVQIFIFSHLAYCYRNCIFLMKIYLATESDMETNTWTEIKTNRTYKIRIALENSD